MPVDAWLNVMPSIWSPTGVMVEFDRKTASGASRFHHATESTDSSDYYAARLRSRASTPSHSSARDEVFNIGSTGNSQPALPLPAWTKAHSIFPASVSQPTILPRAANVMACAIAESTGVPRRALGEGAGHHVGGPGQYCWL